MNSSENQYPDNKKSTSRSLYATLLVVLMTVAVVVAIAGSIAKSTKRPSPAQSAVTTEKKKDPEPEDTEPSYKEGSETDGETLPSTEPDTEPSVQTTAPDTEDAAASANALPTFSAPCSGEVVKSYTGIVPVFSLTMEDWRTHSGIDIYAEPGSSINAVADGSVNEIWDDPMMGKCVSLTHSGGASTIYKNLADELPAWMEKGAAVRAGDTIGMAGESALAEIAEESHLHFEMQIDGTAVNPEEYITFSAEKNFTE